MNSSIKISNKKLLDLLFQLELPRAIENRMLNYLRKNGKILFKAARYFRAMQNLSSDYIKNITIFTFMKFIDHFKDGLTIL